MALAPKQMKAEPGSDAWEEMQEEALARLEDARSQKQDAIQDIEEAYYFAAPRRIREASSQARATESPDDADELQTSLGFEVAEDFMTMLIDSFLPQAGRWAERLADPFLDKANKDRIEREARQQDEMLFQAIRGSNFHAELAKQGVPDAAVGVIAMQIKDPGQGRPFECQAVSIRELEINLGPDGRVDDRFVVRDTQYKHLPALVKGVEFPEEVVKKINDEPDESCQAVWGYWRNWDREDDTVYQHVVLIADKLVHHAELKGDGSCQLIVGRFGADPDFAWPDGPLIKSLPTLREIDEMEAAFIENIDFTIRPPFAYPDDGIMNFEQGIEPGMGYPKRPGSKGEIEELFKRQPIEAAMFEKTQKERMVKRLHYVDFPEQVGKTPPTLGQWLDEMVEAQKKIGTPGYNFWREFPYEAFARFLYLATARGALKPIPGARLHAYNPAQRAQENQEVLTATRLMQIGGSAFPQTWQVVVDELQTLQNVKTKLGDKLVVIRDKSELATAVSNIAQLGGVFGPRLQGGLAPGSQT